MKFLPLIILSSFLTQICFAHGQLFLIGGGKRTPELIQAMIGMANQKSGRILIIPLASEVASEVSETIRNEFLNEKARVVEVFFCQSTNVDEARCLDQINQTDFIFFTGGDQNRLLQSFVKSKALALIHERFKQAQLSLGGTSAGTAIMSEVMITGKVLPPFTDVDGIRPNMIEITSGFGFTKTYILDQHFLKRSRQNRLMSAVLERPNLIGLGIDEATGILLKSDDSFQVFGESTVTVIDARKASIRIDENGNFQTNDLKIELRGKMF